MASHADRTANLLNLLKFSGGSAGSSSQQQQHQQQAQHQAQHQAQQPDHQHQHSHQSRQSSYSQNQYSSPPTRLHQPAPTVADPTGLLAVLMRGATHDAEEARPAAAPAPQQAPDQPAEARSNPFGNGSPSANTTSYLLNLLNRPKPSQTDQPALAEKSRANGAASQSPEITTDSHRFFHQYQQQQQPPQPNAYHQQAQHFPQHGASESYIDVQNQATAGHQYQYSQAPSQEPPADMSALYQQLMGSLAKSSPQSHTSRQASHGPAPPFQLLKKDQPSPSGSQNHEQPCPAASERSPIASPPEQTRHTAHRTSSLHSHQSTRQSTKQTPPTDLGSSVSVEKTSKETVAEAVHDLAEQADKDARESLARAEHNLATADAVQEPTSPDPEWALDEAAVSVVHSIEQQIIENIRVGHEMTPSQGTPEASGANDTSDSGIAAGDLTQEVADSWESADQEEIVVIEEKDAPPVRVYNFPMKPWISISLQEETNEVRPEFRDESIMDIARLKKEFDQIDRNLYTASQTYMTYGMSKQGGLRVIRQDDGKDAKVFTDTKDRIFNVAMSVTPSDHESVQREAIIGTGISGTVYWVQIKDGEKDHIEDPHLEQYGFALPPISSHDGDAPGGVLKTRARASTIHPEFFAVGRGKSINFVWPSYIFQKKLFKAGHDRVVDTESLLKQCSLKINTGKAGKDFTFSQDDTVVVSLDKSGRVKFWDVRDLTATNKEDSDSRSPLPAHSSLEIKEPLMTLATTPEGEKAWPTSVLLLDKQRPYQKRGALRYMVVGMKQNHTLQLWDLALGKPVQELNLPHSKESDAVCSVMYHPASGMIVIGHPTRNSVYFAHLSAPKYNLKNVSQADYIQRLIAQDATIPQPDSTAVISGVREYSFANRGVLRSLDILCNPAMVQDHDEPTLFELYAMHSKGVACVLVKQCELGWSKENKVLDAVDAVKEGLVTVARLKTPQQIELGNGDNKDPLRNAPARPAIREATQQATTTPAQSESTPRSSDSAATPVKPKNEPKEAETPVQSSKEGAAEKPERKARKKKANAVKEAEAVAKGNNANAPRAVQSGKAEAHAKALSNHGPVSNGVTAESFDSAINTMQTRLTAAISETLKSSLKNLQGKIDEGARLRDESFNQHQIKLLDMVSEVLNENTQKVLESLIHHHFTELVIPAIGDKATKAVSDVLQHKLQPNIASSVQKEIQSSLPQALNRSLRSPDVVSAVAERVGKSITATLQQEVAATLTQRLTPAFRNIANQSAQQAVGEIHQQYHDKLEQLKSQHAADSNKIDQLLSYVTRLTDMVSTMAASQSSLQAEFLKLKQQPVHELPGASGLQAVQALSRDGGLGPRGYGPHGYNNNNNNGMIAGSNPQPSIASYQSSQAPSQHNHRQQQQQQQQQFMSSSEYMRGGGGQHLGSPRDSAPQTDLAAASKISGVAGAFASQVNKTDVESEQEIQRRVQVIEQAIKEGRLQDAMIQWIQSGHEKEIFQRCLSLQHPSRFENLPPLVLLVVIATIAKDLRLTPRMKQEIDWIEMAIRSFGSSMPNSDWEQQGFREMMGSVSQTMHLLISRLNPLIAGYDTNYPVDPWLANVERGKMEWIVRSSEHILQTFGGSQGYE
ncbi:hypothetical protein C2857_004987 [Epichloe festucae Fl1]|uniref:EDC4-like protein pdc1 beta-propeller domain-containing protein n=1 Tax=Epichloe festucae (strain Fl1) TaxID=877507 RepID=A0A7U3Q2D9_EPIFF|nr:hypothetical protein C2857_004987 [Epichloe festucae Fl1]